MESLRWDSGLESCGSALLPQPPAPCGLSPLEHLHRSLDQLCWEWMEQSWSLVPEWRFRAAPGSLEMGGCCGSEWKLQERRRSWLWGRRGQALGQRQVSYSLSQCSVIISFHSSFSWQQYFNMGSRKSSLGWCGSQIWLPIIVTSSLQKIAGFWLSPLENLSDPEDLG